jgi:ribosomal protein S18 acetylase RimI-like enzyme
VKTLPCRLPDLQVRQPVALASRLFFEVFNGPNAIAYAHLSARPDTNVSFRLAELDDGESGPGVAYYLRNIEVSVNYRNRGVGTALLGEVVRFCREAQVSSIYGEAKGDLEGLRRWYKGQGFSFHGSDKIKLRLTA